MSKRIPLDKIMLIVKALHGRTDDEAVATREVIERLTETERVLALARVLIPKLLTEIESDYESEGFSAAESCPGWAEFQFIAKQVEEA